MSSTEVISPKPAERALAATDDRQLALKTATGLWAEATTASTTQRRDEVIHDKVSAVRDFFDFTGKSPADVAPADVQAWRAHLESRRSKEGSGCSRRPSTPASPASPLSTPG